MLNVKIDASQIVELQRALAGTKRKLDREIATAINATAKKVRTEAARELKKEMAVPVAILKKVVRNKSKATKDRLSAKIGLFRGYPIPLKYYKATQTKKGVTYKINPKVKRKSILRDAFIAKQYGGNVYKRVGPARGPLQQQYGPAPGDFFDGINLVRKSRDLAEQELKKQMTRRIRFVLMEAAGELRGKRK